MSFVVEKFRGNMSRIVFNYPFMLGFDSVTQTLEKLSKCSDNYPPYNIEQQDTDLVIKIAVAGFDKDDLRISHENNELIIRGEKLAEDNNIVYLHKGISFRRFEKIFVLAEGVEPINSYLDKGILIVRLQKIHIQKDIKLIPIE